MKTNTYSVSPHFNTVKNQDKVSVSLSGKTEEVAQWVRISLPKLFSALTSLLQMLNLEQSGQEGDMSGINAGHRGGFLYAASNVIKGSMLVFLFPLFMKHMQPKSLT